MYAKIIRTCILNRKPAISGGTISALRKLLIEQNQSEFQNPRDPTSINLTKAFTKFDTNRLAILKSYKDLLIAVIDLDISQLNN